MPRVTVIIPTQNKRDSLNRAVQSVIDQSFTDWELFIINDSQTKIEPYLDSRIKIVSNESEIGANGARNTGIDFASGEYIAFLDDDDEWLQPKLEIQLEAMCSQSSILSFTGKNIYLNSKFHKYSFRDAPNWTLYLYNFVGTTSSIMVSAHIIKSLQGFDVSLQQLQDYDLLLRIKNSGSFSGINKPLVNYHMDEFDNHVSINWGKFFKSSIVIWLKQNMSGKVLFPIGILMTFIHKTKNAIN